MAYINLNQDDSALKYATIGFNERPRSQTAYNQFININTKLKDTIALKKAFLTYVKYRNEGFGWFLYLNNIIRLKQTFTPETIALLDSACKLFPTNTELKNLQSIYQNGAPAGQQQRAIVNNTNAVVNERNNNLSLYVTKATYLFSTQNIWNLQKLFYKLPSLIPIILCTMKILVYAIIIIIT